MRAIIVLMLCCPLLVSAADWQEEVTEDGITVSTRQVEGSKHKAVRAEMQIQGSLAQLVALIMDNDTCPELAKLCKQARVVEQISETELYVYSYNNLPWPVADRDAVTHVTWQQNPESLAIEMTAVAVPGKVPETRAVRLKQAVTRWRFEPIPGGMVHVVSEAHLDPEGPIPAWLSNLLLIDAPLDTMKRMRKIIARGRYADASFAFIRESAADD